MKIKELIEWQGSSISFELFPPKTKNEEERLFATITKLASLNPTFVSVTYGAGGGTRQNTRHVIKRIKEETFLTPMPHLTCVSQSEEELTNILGDYQQLGVENILALRGDSPGGVVEPVPKDSLRYARDLVRLAASFETFSIGIAMYPEGHTESPSLEMDMVHARQKIDAGADFAITQMFFDNRFFYQLRERAERTGIRIPIIPGIMPVTDIEKIKTFSQMCGATLPVSLVDWMERATSQEEARRIGVDFATRQCEDLWRNGVRCFHFFTLNHSEVVTEILHNLALDKSRSAALRA